MQLLNRPVAFSPRRVRLVSAYPASARCPTPRSRALRDDHEMALIPISEWIDRYGMLEDAGETNARQADDVRPRSAASSRDGLVAWFRKALMERTVPRLTLRRS